MSDDNKTAAKNLQMVWGPKHQIFYANAFQMRANDSEVSIELGTVQNIGGVDRILSTNQLIITPKSAKTLALLLSKAVENLEDRFGEIKIDDAFLEPLLQAISEIGKTK
jgi:hypothetical protein